MNTARWRCGKTGLVHQLEQRAIVETRPGQLFAGTEHTSYGAPVGEVIAVLWEPACGARRKKNLREGKHEGPVTCLACIGRLS